MWGIDFVLADSPRSFRLLEPNDLTLYERLIWIPCADAPPTESHS